MKKFQKRHTEGLEDDLDGLATGLTTKVDKVAGKGLSTNDYTDAEKTKLAGIDLAATSTADRNRANHTGTQAMSTVAGLDTALGGKAALVHTHTSSQITDFATAVGSLINTYDTQLKGGVPAAGDTLQKLYNLIVSQFSEVTVATLAARNAYNVVRLPTNVFVTDDGDGRWALYKATSTGVGAGYVKLSDPDMMAGALTASQIKTAYESNADTNAFTNALLSKLNGLTNYTDAQAVAAARTGGVGDAAAWVAGPQRLGQLSWSAGRAWRAKSAIANSTVAPESNLANYEPVAPDVTASISSLTTRISTLEQVIQTGEVVAGKEAFIGLSLRAALLKVINEGTTTQPTTTQLSAPGGLSATAQSSTSISFVYAAVANATSYQVQYATNAAFTTGVQTLLNGAATSYMANGLSASTTYYFRVLAVGSGSYTNSPYSSAAQAQTLAPPVSATPPGKVTGLTLTGGDARLEASWLAPAANGAAITDYRVEVRDLAQNGNPFVAFAHAPSGATGLTITGLANGARYQVRVAAINSAGTGAYSDVVEGSPRLVSPPVAIDETSSLLRYEANTFSGNWNFIAGQAFLGSGQTGTVTLGFTGASLRLDLPMAQNGAQFVEIVVNGQVVQTVSQRGQPSATLPVTINVAGNTGSNVLVIRRGAQAHDGQSYLMVHLFTPLDEGGFYRV